MSKKTIACCVFCALFFLVCIVPSVGMLLLGPSAAAGNETQAALPSWTDPRTGSWNQNYFSALGDWFSDHFALRRELITGDSAWKAALFHSSSQDQVALGKEGWLFYAETLDDFTGADSITQRQAFQIARNLRLAQEYCAEQGADFLFTVAPNKVSLYPQFAPSGLSRQAPTAIEVLQPVLGEETVAYADLFAAFAGEEEVLYHRLDSHWNNRGAALAHDTLLNALGMPGGELFAREGTFRDSHQGDLYAMLYPAGSQLDAQWEFSPALDFEYAGNLRSVEDLRITTTSDGPCGSLLMFRDSFGNTLHALLAESFSQALFSRSTPYDLSLISQTQANAVILEIVERNVVRLSTTAFVMPAPDGESPGEISPSGLTADMTLTPDNRLGDYVCVAGTIPDSCDWDSPVLLALSDGGFLEASPAGEGEGTPFTAWVTADSAARLTALVYRKDGQWLSAQLP